MKANARRLPDGCIALDGAAPLVIEGEPLPEAVFEREIGLTGEYKTRGFALARKQFEEVIANHKASGVDPAVDRGHETWLGADPGTEARGWVRSLAIRPSASHPNRDALVAGIELNDLGRNAVANKHFRYLSMGIDLKGKDKMTGAPLGAVLDHLALVKRPFIEGMQPLSLSADSPIAQENPAMLLTLKALGLKDDATDAEMCAAVTAKDAEIVALKSAVAVESAKSAALDVEVKAALHAKLEGELDAKIAAFAVDPAEKPALLSLAKSDAATFSALLALRQPRDPSGPKLSTPKGPAAGREELQTKAVEAYMLANKDVDYTNAMIACSMAQPDLFADEAV